MICWEVLKQDGRGFSVVADRWEITQEGALIFWNDDGASSKKSTAMIFAPGVWATVTNKGKRP